jgi:hypothetical protein
MEADGDSITCLNVMVVPMLVRSSMPPPYSITVLCFSLSYREDQTPHGTNLANQADGSTV